MAWSFHTGTHAPTFHAHVRDAFGGRLPDPPGMPALRAFDTAGAAVLYDAALFHRAPANEIGPRHVFYLRLVGQSAHALLPELRGTLLRDLIVGGTSSSACATSAPRAGRGTWASRTAWRR